MSFEKLGLSKNILKAVNECGYTEPTPIQEQAIPHILMARDLVGLAQTGTGKTASFTLPMIEILAGGRAKARMPRSLILSPTRELAAQIAENFDIYGKYCKLNKALLVGGASMGDQVKILDRGADVLIATPGRLLDLFERGKILLTDIKVLVIDEADRMLDMGFVPDIEKIVSFLSPMRQTLLFSATMPPEIKKLTDKFLSNPREVSVAPPASTADTVEQYIVWTDRRKKRDVLHSLIKKENVQSALIFCNRKRDVDELAPWLQSRGYNAKPLHGDLPQKIRTQTLEDFKAGKIEFLVCSDVAARGIDVDSLSHVFNFDVPTNSDDYVHRIGRTGRAGKTGYAFMLATPSEEKDVVFIEKLTKKKITVLKLDCGAQGKDNRGAGRSSASKSMPQNSRKSQSKSKSKFKSQARSCSQSRLSSQHHDQPKSVSKPISQAESHEALTREKNAPSKPKTEQKKMHSEQRHEEPDNTLVGFGDDIPGFLKKN